MNVAAPSVQQTRYVYVIQECQELPQIDCVRTIKHLFLSGPRLQRLNRWLSHKKRWLALALLAGIVNTFAVPFLPAKVGRIVAFFGLTQLPSIVAALISLRYDMIRLILGTYEFWNLTCMNVAFFIASSMCYHDTRVIALVPGLLSFELLVLQDANYRALNLTIAVFCFIAIVHVVLTVYVSMDLIDQWRIVGVVRYGTHYISANNIVTTYLINTTAVLLRNAYRKHRWIRDCNGGETTIVRCIAYTCRVRLSRQSAPRMADIPLIPRLYLHGRTELIRLVPSDDVYDSVLAVLHPLISVNQVVVFFSSEWRQKYMHSIGLAGWTLTCISLVQRPQAEFLSPSAYTGLESPILSVSSAIISGLYCGFFLSICQRQLLYKLVTSYDFLLLSMNITLVHLCVADTFHWTPKCFGLLSSWMWIVWATTADALTPNMRQALGLHKYIVLFVVMGFIVLVVLLVVEIIFVQQWNLQDRDLFRVWSTRVKVVQVLFSCLFSLLPMCFRIAWRLFNAREGDLILIQGIVEHEDSLLAQRRQRELSSRISRQSLKSSRRSLRSQKSRSLLLLSGLSRSSRVQPAGPNDQLWQVNAGIT